jgi:AraC-like DNA-binding protein
MPVKAGHRATGTLSARVVVRVADFVAARGHDPERFCRSVGVSLEALRDPAARVPYTLAESLGERAAELVGDANLGLHLAATVQDTRGFDAGLLMLMASPSVRAALERMTRYQRYWGDGERSRLVRAPGGVCVRYALPGQSGAARRHSDECAMAEILLGIRLLSGRDDLVPRAVRFRHPAPPDTREHAALFRCRLEFGASHTELDLDDVALDAPMRDANEAFCAIFQQQVERALAALPGESGTAAPVRAAARAALAGGACTLAGTARMLGLGARTMQRRLHAEGTSFEELVDALRREMALAYLDKEVPIPQIAWLLGYADASAFHRAFKRWTGKSPERARAARRG